MITHTDEYFYVTSAATVGKRIDKGEWQDKALKEAGNYFTDVRKAQQAANKIGALYKLLQL